ncbi:MAG: nodulation protein NfeD [Gemmatimonadetes bacterium]|nr:nodulation protein NfeD [Gemmatimonadota bacterium]
MLRSWILLGFAVSGIAGTTLGQERTVYRIPVTGTIENGLAPYVARLLREAAEAGADAALLDIDTPGGRVDAAERIVNAVRGSTVPVYAFVNPRAYSAGAMIALAAKEIYLDPAGVLGAATPVDGQGGKMSEKYVSAMRAAFRALAEASGRDPAVAEAMVDESIEVPGVKAPGKLLTLTAAEAIKLGYGKPATGTDALLAAVGLEGARVVTPKVNWAEMVVRFLTNPVVSPLLLSLGMLGLVFEIKAGHFGIGGLVSLTSLGLFFGSGIILGLAGWEEIILLGLGFLAIGIEVFLLPGFGVAGVLGLGLVATSLVMGLLGSFPTAGDFGMAGLILLAAVVITVSVVYGWLRHLPTSTRFRRILLQDGLAANEGYVSALPRGDLVGKTGTAVTDLRPAGTALVGDERLDVVSEGAYIKQGATITVLHSDGYRHVVRATD